MYFSIALSQMVKLDAQLSSLNFQSKVYKASIFWPSMNAKGPEKDAFIPSSLAFLTIGHKFAHTAASAGINASEIRRRDSFKYVLSFAAF